jgi:hypothetical protein
MDEDEFTWQAKKMKSILVPDLVLIVEVKGEPAGFSLSLPDINPALRHMKGRMLPWGIIKFLLHRKEISGLRVLAMGMRPEHRSIGAEGVLIQRTIDNGLHLGYKWAELSWVLEDNTPMRRLAENMGARAYRRYRIWEMPLEKMPW